MAVLLMIPTHLDCPAEFRPEEGIMDGLIGVQAEEDIARFCPAEHVREIGVLERR